METIKAPILFRVNQLRPQKRWVHAQIFETIHQGFKTVIKFRAINRAFHISTAGPNSFPANDKPRKHDVLGAAFQDVGQTATNDAGDQGDATDGEGPAEEEFVTVVRSFWEMRKRA